MARVRVFLEMSIDLLVKGFTKKFLPSYLMSASTSKSMNFPLLLFAIRCTHSIRIEFFNQKTLTQTKEKAEEKTFYISQIWLFCVCGCCAAPSAEGSSILRERKKSLLRISGGSKQKAYMYEPNKNFSL